MTCETRHIVIGERKPIPSFDLRWVGEYFLLTYQGPDIENSLVADAVFDDLTAIAECACTEHAGTSMRLGEIGPCVHYSLSESVLEIGSEALNAVASGAQPNMFGAFGSLKVEV